MLLCKNLTLAPRTRCCCSRAWWLKGLGQLWLKINIFETQKQKPSDYKCYLKAKTRLNNKITRKRKKIRKIFFISILISRQKIEIPIFIFHSSCNLIQTHTHTHTHTHVLNCFFFCFCRSSRRRPPSRPPSSESWPSSRLPCWSGARWECARVCRIQFRPLARFRPWRSPRPLLSSRPPFPLLVEVGRGVSLHLLRRAPPDESCRTETWSSPIRLFKKVSS